MKNILPALLVAIFTLSSYAQEQTTTYYLVRHAEKDRSDITNKNPALTEIGTKRAIQWSEVFKNITFDAVYSTDYQRTLQTAGPTARKNNLEIKIYDPRDMYNETFAEETKGKTILIVGHSNTTPFFANKILGINKYEEIDDSNNSNLYVVTCIGEKRTSQIFYIN